MHSLPDALPILAVGSHVRGSGKACIMNAISYLNGDSQITDFPGCADPVLARLAQRLNDGICRHREGEVLCSACSGVVWRLGTRLIGTADRPGSALHLRTWESWFRVALVAIERRWVLVEQLMAPRPHLTPILPEAVSALRYFGRYGQLPPAPPVTGVLNFDNTASEPAIGWRYAVVNARANLTRNLAQNLAYPVPEGAVTMQEILQHAFTMIDTMLNFSERIAEQRVAHALARGVLGELEHNVGAWLRDHLDNMAGATLAGMAGKVLEQGFTAILEAWEREFPPLPTREPLDLSPERLAALKKEIVGATA